MTEPTKDAIVAALSIVTVLVAVVACGPRAPGAGYPPALGSDETPEPLQTRRQREAPTATRDRTGSASPLTASGILDQVLPLGPDGSPVPTPFPATFILEVSPSGNVVLPSAPSLIVTMGRTPYGVVPPRCRADFLRLPRDAALVCMLDAELYERLTGGGL